MTSTTRCGASAGGIALPLTRRASPVGAPAVLGPVPPSPACAVAIGNDASAAAAASASFAFGFLR
jgi:hypothetical protein